MTDSQIGRSAAAGFPIGFLVTWVTGDQQLGFGIAMSIFGATLLFQRMTASGGNGAH